MKNSNSHVWIRIMTAFLSAILISGASAGGLAADPLSKTNRLPPSLEQKVQDVKNELERGYEVTRGYWTLWSTDDCKFPLQSVGFCYGNNPTAPYVVAVLPPWEDEFVDQSLHHALLQGHKGMTPIYRLGEREALVVMAELPPPGRYLGLETNVFTREDELNKEDDVYKILSADPITADLLRIIFATSPNPNRMMMISSIGDTINNVVIEEQSKENWGEQRFFVITPDEDMADEMTAALVSVGADTSHVFTEPVSPDLVRLGYGPEADDFITYFRYAMPNDIALGEQWREQLPLTILRVRALEDGPAIEPFDIPKYEVKTANTDETELGDELESLVDAVKEYWSQTSPDNSAEFRSLSIWIDLVGQHCLGYDGPPPTDGIDLPRGPMNCLGDNPDADYRISAGTYYLDDDQVIAVVGTLGTKTGNATYTSLAVNWFPQLVGVISRDDTVLEESAKKFKDAISLSDPELYKKFYVYYFARDCSGLYPWCKEIPVTQVPRGDTIKILQRNYVTPGERRGPDPYKVLNPVSIEFDGNSRPTE